MIQNGCFTINKGVQRLGIFRVLRIIRGFVNSSNLAHFIFLFYAVDLYYQKRTLLTRLAF